MPPPAAVRSADRLPVQRGSADDLLFTVLGAHPVLGDLGGRSLSGPGEGDGKAAVLVDDFVGCQASPDGFGKEWVS